MLGGKSPPTPTQGANPWQVQGPRPRDTGGPRPARWPQLAWRRALGAAPGLSTDSGRGQNTEESPGDRVSMDKAGREHWDYSGGEKGPVLQGPKEGTAHMAASTRRYPDAQAPNTPSKVVSHKPQDVFP